MAFVSSIFQLLLLAFVLFFYFTNGHVLKSDGEKKIKWPKEYHVKGEIFEFHTDILLPFEIWYSETYNKSRIDLDGGTVKKFYVLNSNDSHAFGIHPVSDEDGKSEMKCYISRLSHRYLLLNTTGLKYTGRSTVMFGRQVDEWTSTEIYKEIYIRNQTFYVYTDDDGHSVPVRNIEQVYISTDREVSKHTVYDYYQIDSNVTEKDVKLPIEDPLEDCVYNADLMSDLKYLHPNVPGAVDIAFESYANHHNKKYHEKDVKSRKKIFEENWRMVIDHNRKNSGFKLKINEFSDQTDEELNYLAASHFLKNTLLEFAKIKPSKFILEGNVTLPQNYDSREEGIVTSVKNQGYCGSCWAFATAAAVEIAIGKCNNTKMLDLSEQSLVDCGWELYQGGCEGGDPYAAMHQVQEYGIATELQYGGYKAIDGVCKISNMTSTYKISESEVMYNADATNIKQAIIKYGAVVAVVRATNIMKQYSNGIFYENIDCDNSGSNHAVTIIGYGVHEGEDYWLVKNSWGKSWGEAGYIRMSSRNCFIQEYIIYPIP